MKYPRRGRDSQTNWPLGGCGGPTASIRVNPRSRHSCSSAVTSLNGSVRCVMKKVTDVAGIQPLKPASTKRKATCARTGAIYWCGLTRNRTPKWGVETPRRWGRVRQGYPQALVSSNWHGCLSPARSLCVRRRVVVKVAAERRLMARKRKRKLKAYSHSGVGSPFSRRNAALKSLDW